ncbi:hypothetical protein FOL47_009329, partial [Perkinsus chesapeaki]
ASTWFLLWANQSITAVIIEPIRAIEVGKESWHTRAQGGRQMIRGTGYYLTELPKFLSDLRANYIAEFADLLLPVDVVHGTSDESVSVETGEKLANLLPNAFIQFVFMTSSEESSEVASLKQLEHLLRVALATIITKTATEAAIHRVVQKDHVWKGSQSAEVIRTAETVPVAGEYLAGGSGEAVKSSDDTAQNFLSVVRHNEARIVDNADYRALDDVLTDEDIWGSIRLLASDGSSQGAFGSWSNPVIIISSVVAAVALFFLVCCCGCGYISGIGGLVIVLALGGWIIYIKLQKN